MRQKMKRFAANKLLNNLIEPGKPIYQTIKGKWNKVYFKNNHPITLEIGCGDGTYAIGLAIKYPARNFIGIDIKGDRLWKGAEKAQHASLQNIAFLRIQIEHLLAFFAHNEISEIWTTFPDPRPKNKDIKRRLTSPRFLLLYQTILITGGKVHFKTDSTLLFQYTLDLLAYQKIQPLAIITDLYGTAPVNNDVGIQTTYEKRFVSQNIPIKYLCFIPKETIKKPLFISKSNDLNLEYLSF